MNDDYVRSSYSMMMESVSMATFKICTQIDSTFQSCTVPTFTYVMYARINIKSYIIQTHTS